jgi:hypothetical protein
MILAVLGGLACGPQEDRQALARRPLLPKSDDGWTRLPLDVDAQRRPGELWVGDEAGRPVPSLRGRSGLWGQRQLDVEKLLLGTDPEGRPSAEFRLRLPPTWSIRDREQLRIDLDLQGTVPWVCRVDVSRRMEGPALFGLPRESPIHLQDLGGKDGVASFLVPWDSLDYRVVLQALSGSVPSLRSLKVTAVTESAGLEIEKSIVPAEVQCEIQAPAPERWRLRLGSVERVVGLEIHLKVPSAPVKPSVMLPPPESDPSGSPRPLASKELLWNFADKRGRGSRIVLEPLLTDRLLLGLPAGSRLDSVRVLVRSDELLFPVQAGRRYWLHLGGKANPAGDAGTLPPSRLIYGRDPIRMGPTEPDPQGLPRSLPSTRKVWLRWGAFGAAAALALLAAALLWLRRED